MRCVAKISACSPVDCQLQPRVKADRAFIRDHRTEKETVSRQGLAPTRACRGVRSYVSCSRQCFVFSALRSAALQDEIKHRLLRVLVVGASEESLSDPQG